MAKKTRDEVAVGLTVIAALGLAIYVVIALGDWDNLFTSQKEITVRLPYQIGLKGLTTASPVYLGGSKIGQIVGARIEPPAGEGPAEDIYVSFTMKIPARYPLREDCSLAAESNVLGGQASLEIKTLGRQGPILNDGATITLTQFPGGISDAMDGLKQQLDTADPDSLISRLRYELDRDQAESLLARLRDTAANLSRLTGEMDKEFSLDQTQAAQVEAGQTIRAQIHQVLAQIKQSSAHIRDELDAEGEQTAMVKLKTTLDEMDSVLKKLDRLIETNEPKLAQTMDSLKNIAADLEEKLPRIVDKIDSSLANANNAIDSANDTLKDVRRLVDVNRDTIDRIIRNFNEMSVNLKIVSRDVRRAPWKLLYKPDEQEVQVQAVIDSTGSFVAGAERLDELALRLKSLLLIPDTDRTPAHKDHIEAMIQQLESSFAEFKKVEEGLWKMLQ